MSVLIKGMEMPKSCYECVFKHKFFKNLNCGVERLKGKKYPEFSDKRHPDCPLVEIPTPHGRLIDENDMFRMAKEYGSDCIETFRAIEDTPTVIEAEES